MLENREQTERTARKVGEVIILCFVSHATYGVRQCPQALVSIFAASSMDYGSRRIPLIEEQPLPVAIKLRVVSNVQDMQEWKNLYFKI